MKKVLCCIFFSSIFSFLVSCDGGGDSSVANVDGIWTGTVETRTGLIEKTLTIFQDGNSLYATETGVNSAHEYDGTIEGDDIVLTANEVMPHEEANRRIIFYLTLFSENSLSGVRNIYDVYEDREPLKFSQAANFTR